MSCPHLEPTDREQWNQSLSKGTLGTPHSLSAPRKASVNRMVHLQPLAGPLHWGWSDHRHHLAMWPCLWDLGPGHGPGQLMNSLGSPICLLPQLTSRLSVAIRQFFKHMLQIKKWCEASWQKWKPEDGMHNTINSWKGRQHLLIGPAFMSNNLFFVFKLLRPRLVLPNFQMS